MPFERGHIYSKKFMKHHLNYRIKASDSYSLGKSSGKFLIFYNKVVTPVIQARPSSAKLHSLKTAGENKSKTPLQDFLEMKRTLCFNKHEELINSQNKKTCTEEKNTEVKYTRKAQLKYKR